MKRNRDCKRILTVVLATWAVAGFVPLADSTHALDPAPSGRQTEAPSSKAPAKNAKKPPDATLKSAADQPIWDPLRAEKDLEVGQYYMKKGDLDAAIDRFQDAAIAKPGYAIPFRYLGEAQEKKGQKREAIKSYTRYLDLYPHAEDATKVRKKIAKLWSDVGGRTKSAR